MSREVESVELSLVTFFEKVRSEESLPPRTWEAVSERIRSEGSNHQRGSLRLTFPSVTWRWAAGASAVVLLLTLGSAALFAISTRSAGTVSAEKVLEKAERATLSPQDAGIDSLEVTQEYTSYFLGAERRDVPASKREFNVWYEGPDRLRIESEYRGLDFDGTVHSSSVEVNVWAGTEHWQYDQADDSATVFAQAPSVDVYEQGVVRGASPGQPQDLFASTCRTVTTSGEEVIAGRTAHILELGRPQCGIPVPGADGKLLLWVEEDTGFILRLEQYAVDGQLYAVREVTDISLNQDIEETRFHFEPPQDVVVDDLRDQPPGIGNRSQLEQPMTISIEEARDSASFEILVPSELPDSFELQSVEHYGADAAVRNIRADWVLLRYADEDGNWLAVAEGYGGAIISARHLMAPPPPPSYTGTFDLRGRTAHWVNGTGLLEQWEPGTMASVGWVEEATPPPVGGTGDSQLLMGLASNSLSIEQLAAVAESLR